MEEGPYYGGSNPPVASPGSKREGIPDVGSPDVSSTETDATRATPPFRPSASPYTLLRLCLLGRYQQGFSDGGKGWWLFSLRLFV